MAHIVQLFENNDGKIFARIAYENGSVEKYKLDLKSEPLKIKPVEGDLGTDNLIKEIEFKANRLEDESSEIEFSKDEEELKEKGYMPEDAKKMIEKSVAQLKIEVAKTKVMQNAQNAVNDAKTALVGALEEVESEKAEYEKSRKEFRSAQKILESEEGRLNRAEGQFQILVQNLEQAHKELDEALTSRDAAKDALDSDRVPPNSIDEQKLEHLSRAQLEVKNKIQTVENVSSQVIEADKLCATISQSEALRQARDTVGMESVKVITAESVLIGKLKVLQVAEEDMAEKLEEKGEAHADILKDESEKEWPEWEATIHDKRAKASGKKIDELGEKNRKRSKLDHSQYEERSDIESGLYGLRVRVTALANKSISLDMAKNSVAVVAEDVAGTAMQAMREARAKVQPVKIQPVKLSDSEQGALIVYNEEDLSASEEEALPVVDPVVIAAQEVAQKKEAYDQLDADATIARTALEATRAQETVLREKYEQACINFREANEALKAAVEEFTSVHETFDRTLEGFELRSKNIKIAINERNRKHTELANQCAALAAELEKPNNSDAIERSVPQALDSLKAKMTELDEKQEEAKKELKSLEIRNKETKIYFDLAEDKFRDMQGLAVHKKNMSENVIAAENALAAKLTEIQPLEDAVVSKLQDVEPALIRLNTAEQAETASQNARLSEELRQLETEKQQVQELIHKANAAKRVLSLLPESRFRARIDRIDKAVKFAAEHSTRIKAEMKQKRDEQATVQLKQEKRNRIVNDIRTETKAEIEFRSKSWLAVRDEARKLMDKAVVRGNNQLQQEQIEADRVGEFDGSRQKFNLLVVEKDQHKNEFEQRKLSNHDINNVSGIIDLGEKIIKASMYAVEITKLAANAKNTAQAIRDEQLGAGNTPDESKITTLTEEFADKIYRVNLGVEAARGALKDLPPVQSVIDANQLADAALRKITTLAQEVVVTAENVAANAIAKSSRERQKAENIRAEIAVTTFNPHSSKLSQLDSVIQVIDEADELAKIKVAQIKLVHDAVPDLIQFSDVYKDYLVRIEDNEEVVPHFVDNFNAERIENENSLKQARLERLQDRIADIDLDSDITLGDGSDAYDGLRKRRFVLEGKRSTNLSITHNFY